MTLSMKSYKGFNKFPYCNAHIPQVKPTTTVNSLEARRLAELTKLQSQVKYHENFEKSKGKVTQIADDVEMQRLKQNSKIISNASYHGELERKQQMEQKRNQVSDHQMNERNKALDNNLINNLNLINGNHQKNGQYIDNQLHNQNNLNNQHNKHFNGQSVFSQTKEQHAQILHQQKLPEQQKNIYQLHHQQQPQDYINPQKVAQYVSSSQQLLHQQQQQRLINQSHNQIPAHNPQFNQSQLNPNLISQQQIQYQSQFNGQNHFINQQQQPNVYVQQQQPQKQADWSADQQNRVFRAIYDYTAADHDEVSFVDGDLITDCEFIDEGWMTGVIQRTGQYGMLPANYVQPYYIHS